MIFNFGSFNISALRCYIDDDLNEFILLFIIFGNLYVCKCLICMFHEFPLPSAKICFEIGSHSIRTHNDDISINYEVNDPMYRVFLLWFIWLSTFMECWKKIISIVLHDIWNGFFLVCIQCFYCAVVVSVAS